MVRETSAIVDASSPGAMSSEWCEAGDAPEGLSPVAKDEEPELDIATDDAASLAKRR